MPMGFPPTTQRCDQAMSRSIRRTTATIHLDHAPLFPASFFLRYPGKERLQARHTLARPSGSMSLIEPGLLVKHRS